jgi:hypothetical protein
VVVIAVDEEHVHRRVLEGTGSEQAAKSAADYDHPGASLRLQSISPVFGALEAVDCLASEIIT